MLYFHWIVVSLVIELIGQLQDAIDFEDSKECSGQQRLRGFHQFNMTRLSSECELEMKKFSSLQRDLNS